MIKKFTIQIVLRTMIILVASLCIAFFTVRQNWFTVGGLVIAISMVLLSLVRYVNNTNYTLVKFLNALKNKDYSVYFQQTQQGNSFKDVFDDFNSIIKMFKQNKIDKEAQFEYFKQILEQISVGIISIDRADLEANQTDHEILFLNKAACEILDLPRHKYWHRIAQQVPWLEKEISEMINGGKKLVAVGKDLGQQQLTIEVANIELVGTPYLIITIKDIHSEIEQKEMEAWHNIIRVLAHEMMNSFTPVSSLASTIKSMTEDSQGTVVHASELEDESIIDINLGVSTIQRRAEGLLEFVNDYRRLSNVPVPDLKRVSLVEFFEHVERLMRPVVEQQNIRLEIKEIPPRATVKMDAKLIEQVFINLIGNSIHALKEQDDPCILLECTMTPKNIVLSVHDNGKGILPEIRDNIFVPFYTTREKGSGIGLSLSKTIMRSHHGNIFVQSEPDKYTKFSLSFPS